MIFSVRSSNRYNSYEFLNILRVLFSPYVIWINISDKRCREESDLFNSVLQLHHWWLLKLVKFFNVGTEAILKSVSLIVARIWGDCSYLIIVAFFCFISIQYSVKKISNKKTTLNDRHFDFSLNWSWSKWIGWFRSHDRRKSVRTTGSE